MSVSDAVTPIGRSHALTGYRNVLAVVAGLTILQAAMAALAVSVTLNLRAAGTSNAVLGIIASCFAAGFLIGTLLSPREIARIGHIRAFALFAAIATVAALVLGAGISPFGWALVQLVLGLSCAGLLTAGESWVSDASPENQRGAILAFYHMVSKTGAIIGPFLVSFVAIGTFGFMITAALFAASLIPITTTDRAQPELATALPFGPKRIFEYAPAAAYAALAAGAVNNAVAQLYPVFAAEFFIGNGQEMAAQMNAAILLGAMVGLWPFGLVSDRIDRRIVIAVGAAIGAAAAAGLVFSTQSQSQVWLFIAAFFFGLGSLSYYALAVAHAADRSQPQQVTSMMAGMLMIWGIGSILGPILAGLVMSLMQSAVGLFWFAALALFFLSISMFTRAARSDPVPDEEKEPFGVAPATSYAIAEFDPRGEEEQLDLFSDPEQEPLR